MPFFSELLHGLGDAASFAKPIYEDSALDQSLTSHVTLEKSDDWNVMIGQSLDLSKIPTAPWHVQLPHGSDVTKW
jgi:ABC-type antimicrobial peptide transport system permease subunit